MQKKVRDLIGENPHQKAELYLDDKLPKSSLFSAEVIFGRELSYNDIIDSDAALSLIREFKDDKDIISVMFHHGNPCGLAKGKDHSETFDKVVEISDPTSIIEGIYISNAMLTPEVAKKISNLFLNVVIVNGVEEAAIGLLKDQHQLTIINHPNMFDNEEKEYKEVKRLNGGYLYQDYNSELIKEINCITIDKVSEYDLEQLIIAWKVAKHTKTNAIVLVRDSCTVGIGPGLNNRIWSTMQAIERAGSLADGSYMASDAIIPLPESIELAGNAGVKAIIEPGGWYKERENIVVAEKYHIAMVTTGINQFKH